MAKQQGPLKDLILQAASTILDEAIPQVERALVVAEGLQPASIAIAVKWTPNQETGELELSVVGKTTTPTTKTLAKTRIESGQLTLL
jgi:hypothetical protein